MADTAVLVEVPQPRRRAQDSVTVGCSPPATQQAQDQAEVSGEPVAVVEPQVRSRAHRGATDYGKWDAFVDDDSDRMASEPRDDRAASTWVRGRQREPVFLFL